MAEATIGRFETPWARTVVALVVMVASLLAWVPAQAQDPTVRRLAGDTRIETAVAVSAASHPDGAEAVVIAAADDPADALAGGPLAAALDAPLLLTDRASLPSVVADELNRLGTKQVVVLGGRAAVGAKVVDQLRASGREVLRLEGANRVETSLVIADALLEAVAADSDDSSPPRPFIASGRAFADALAVAPVAAASGDPVLMVEGEATADVREWLDDRGVTEAVVVGGEAVVSQDQVATLESASRPVTRIAGVDRYDTAAQVADLAIAEGASSSDVWLATGTGFADSLAAGPAVAAAGATLLLVDGDRPWSTRPATDRLLDWQPDAVTAVGGPAAVSGDLAWQLPTVLAGADLPGGGFTLFPDHHLVAFYGSHVDTRLGVLGEQDPDAAFARLSEVAAEHAVFGRQVQPVFELIVSVATSGPGPDGDYSRPSTPEEIQPWLDAAHRHGVILLLDIQTGRASFMEHARKYESFLRDPWVGLALDPEWRMDPDEVPGRSVGETSAAEINEVTEWLAAIVREEALPEKLVVLHQFQLRMIEQREDVVARPELGTILHMDGFGSREQKLDTYRALTATPGPWRMGFKLFYDEDTNMFAPADLVGVAPTLEFISYQ